MQNIIEAINKGYHDELKALYGSLQLPRINEVSAPPFLVPVIAKHHHSLWNPI